MAQIPPLGAIPALELNLFSRLLTHDERSGAKPKSILLPRGDKGRPVDESKNEEFVLLSVSSPEVEIGRVPSDVILVVDVSGSMGERAVVEGVDTGGMTLLDIVKHAVLTVINTMTEHDRLALVSFSDNAIVNFGLMPMSESAKAQATSITTSLVAQGRTNIWDGLEKSMDLLASSEPLQGDFKYRNSAVLLLTDGEPNVEPQGGHIAAMRRYCDSNGGHYPGIVSTFGFGYSLDSELLRSVSLEGGGMYAFIPDSSFVGTVFVNALSNLLSTSGVGATLSIETEPDVKIIDDPKLYAKSNHVISSWGWTVTLGTIILGQTKDYIIRIEYPKTLEKKKLNVVLKYRPPGLPFEEEPVMLEKSGPPKPASAEELISWNEQKVDSELFRAKFIQVIAASYKHMIEYRLQDAPAVLNELIGAMDKWKLKHTDLGAPNKRSVLAVDHLATVKDTTSYFTKVAAMLQDADGQVSEAVSRIEYFMRWGRHYLPSLMRAHELQQCNNFKDPGIQHYGGASFAAIRDFADLTFRFIEPPQASGPRINMAVLNNRDMPCFHESSSVRLAGGAVTEVQHLQRGDVLHSGATVECLVRTVISGGVADLVRVRGSELRITAWHPVLFNNTWTFPAHCGVVESTKCSAVYSVLLQKESPDRSDDSALDVEDVGMKAILRTSYIDVDGLRCLALAHDVMDDPVASHDYFGSDRVMQDLQRCAGWKTGRISFPEGSLQRDDSSGLVVGFDREKEILEDIED